MLTVLDMHYSPIAYISISKRTRWTVVSPNWQLASIQYHPKLCTFTIYFITHILIVRTKKKAN